MNENQETAFKSVQVYLQTLSGNMESTDGFTKMDAETRETCARQAVGNMFRAQELRRALLEEASKSRKLAEELEAASAALHAHTNDFRSLLNRLVTPMSLAQPDTAQNQQAKRLE